MRTSNYDRSVFRLNEFLNLLPLQRHSPENTLSQPLNITIEDWDVDSAIRIPDAALQELGVDVGNTVYLIEGFVGNTRCLVLSETAKMPERIDELFATTNTPNS
jgi:antitoxin component of MazEF toxin-antitoxin module